MNSDPHPAILILALEPDDAAKISYRAHSVGFVPFAPRDGETALEAAFRLRPSVVLVQIGRPELSSDAIESMACALGASFFVFGDEGPELHRIAEAHGGKTVAINASRREFGSAIAATLGA